MTASLRNSPGLPLEIIEQILEVYGIEEAEQWDDPCEEQTSYRYHTKAIRACHMVSRQFRACALRVICRRTVIDLQDTPRRLQRLQDVIFGEPNPASQLDRPLRFVKEIVVILTNSMFNRWQRPTYSFDSLEIVIPLLNTIRDNVPIEKLSIFGNTMPGSTALWPRIEPAILHALETLIQLPSVVSLNIRDIRHLPHHLPAMPTSLHTLNILRSDYGQYLETEVVPSVTATLKKLENLTIHFSSQFPKGLELPALRILSAIHRYPTDSEASWSSIQRSCQTLVQLTVDDGEGEDDTLPPFLKTLNLSSFPQLESFTYIFSSTHYREMFPKLLDLASFLYVHCPMPNLRVIKLGLRLQGRKAFHEDYLSVVRNHPAWQALDTALASGHFPGIESAYIYLQLSFSEDIIPLWDGTINLNGSADALSASIMASFSQSKMFSIPIGVDVDIVKC